MKAAVLSAIVCCSLGACASGEVIVSHYGAADPETEGWDYRLWGADMAVGPVIDDDGYDAWSLYDDDPASYGFYAARLWEWDVVRAFEMGWKLTARVRLVDAPDRATRMIYIDAIIDTGRWPLLLGADDDGATLVSVGDNWGFKTFRLEGSGYRLIEIVYHPGGYPRVASLFVDGILILDDWRDRGALGDISDIRFGSYDWTDVGGGHYNLVKWEILPEPAAVSVLVAGAIGLLRRRRL